MEEISMGSRHKYIKDDKLSLIFVGVSEKHKVNNLDPIQ